MRVELDLRGEQISYKVREHSHAKVPVIIALGKQEVEKRTCRHPPLTADKNRNLWR